MTFKRMASELAADKLAAAARVLGAPDALGLCSRAADSKQGPAQLCSVLSMTLNSESKAPKAAFTEQLLCTSAELGVAWVFPSCSLHHNSFVGN